MGVALWLAPDAAPDEEALAAALTDSVPSHRLQPIFWMFEQMDASHPREPHWHLPLIGVHPALQGQGIGSALLRHALATCDEQHLPAYLEATSPANVRLYERHGFQAIGRIQAADSPPVIPMLRKPSPRLN
jgi:ribosomal protein S18 acetylase RimI-like enzyme